MSIWTYDEMTMMEIYNAGTRTDTIAAMEEMKQYLEPDEQELMSLTDQTIRKLKNISDEEYLALELYPEA